MSAALHFRTQPRKLQSSFVHSQSDTYHSRELHTEEISRTILDLQDRVRKIDAVIRRKEDQVLRYKTAVLVSIKQLQAPGPNPKGSSEISTDTSVEELISVEHAIARELQRRVRDYDHRSSGRAAEISVISTELRQAKEDLTSVQHNIGICKRVLQSGMVPRRGGSVPVVEAAEKAIGGSNASTNFSAEC